VSDPLVAIPGFGGATELGDGRVSLILDTAALLRVAHEQREFSATPAAASRATSPVT
jgi:chemotaxis protein histidine kinase CheA